MFVKVTLPQNDGQEVRINVLQIVALRRVKDITNCGGVTYIDTADENCYLVSNTIEDLEAQCKAIYGG